MNQYVLASAAFYRRQPKNFGGCSTSVEYRLSWLSAQAGNAVNKHVLVLRIGLGHRPLSSVLREFLDDFFGFAFSIDS